MRYSKISMQKLLKWFSYFVGVFVTMPIITIQLKGRLISVFSILYIFLVFLLALAKIKSSNITKLKLGRMGRHFFLWLLLATLSSLFGLLFFNFSGKIEWFNAAISYIPKILSFAILLILVSSSKYKAMLIEWFFKGFLLGCVLNVVWACIEGIIFYVKGLSINNIIFYNYANTLPPDRRYITIVMTNRIRTPGFNYDPAHLGGIIPIVVSHSILNKRYGILMLGLVALAFSQSTTALISSMALVAMYYLGKKITANKKYNIKKIGYFVILATLIILIIAFSPVSNNRMVHGIKTNIYGFMNRVFTVYISNSSSNIRTLYHIYLPRAAGYSGFKTITGTGFGTSSYAYVNDPYLREKLSLTSIKPYDPESTYISYLFDTGIFGLVMYVYILLKLFTFYNRRRTLGYNNYVLSTIGGIIMSGFFYHYTLTAYQIISIIMATSLMDMQNNKEVSYYEQ